MSKRKDTQGDKETSHKKGQTTESTSDLEEIKPVKPPKLCHVIKWPEFKGDGFKVDKVEKDHDEAYWFVSKVDDNSPAQAAGMLEMDRVIEMNDVNIECKSNKQVNKLWNSIGNEVKLLLVDKEAYIYYKSQKIPMSSCMPRVRFISSGPGSGCERVDWSNFKKRQSDSGRYGDPPKPIMYHHSLPDASQIPFTENALDAHYEEFDTICHVTSLENAMQIFKANSLQLQKVSDNSVVTGCTFPLNGTRAQQPLHPVNNARVLWYGPQKKSNIGNPHFSVERYGNVVFSMKTLHGYEGICRRPGEFKYYFIEEIHYQTSSACRILVTFETYPRLRKYDPMLFGGPWFIGGGKQYYRKNCTLEIMREGSSNKYMHDWWLKNHSISFSYCKQPRPGVKAVKKPEDTGDLLNDYSMQTLRLVFCLGKNVTKFQFSEQNEKLYEWIKTLHNEAAEGFSQHQLKGSFPFEKIRCLMSGFTNMFMDADRKVVEVYGQYLQYMCIVSAVKYENLTKVPEILGKDFGIL